MARLEWPLDSIAELFCVYGEPGALLSPAWPVSLDLPAMVYQYQIASRLADCESEQIGFMQLMKIHYGIKFCSGS